MKRVMVVGMIAVALAITPDTGKAEVVSETDAAAQVHTGHLDWDKVDQTWRCVGSPINCDFGVE